MWALIKDERTKKENKPLELIEAGDYLVIYNLDNSIIFRGKIIPDYKTGQRKCVISGKMKQSAFDVWICWTQKGWKPEDWASLFIRGKRPFLKAQLVKVFRNR